MTEPYLGEVQIFGFTFPPYEWAMAAGQSVPVQQYAALYSLIGTTFGGNGTTNFQLPNLTTRTACGDGTGPGLSQRTIGSTAGEPSVTLNTNQMPAHTHALNTFQNGSTFTAAPTTTSSYGYFQGANAFGPPPPPVLMSPMLMQPNAGAGQPHENRQPFLALNFCMSLYGQFPSFP